MNRTLLILIVLSLPAWGHECTDTLAELRPDWEQAKVEALAVRAEFENYFGAVRQNVLEADYLVDVLELALIAEEHVMLVGPPGTAKTMVADLVLGGMRETVEKEGATIQQPSYFSIQMTPETTMSETHGPFDYPKLSQGQYVRMLDQGMVMSRNVFIDEIFDGRANAQRNILQAINERRHTQGTHHTPGRIETSVAATNFYQSQVYEKAGNDGPKAVFDRYAFVAFVPSEFEDIESDIALIQRAKRPKIAVPPLQFENLEKIRALVSEVDIPDHVAEFLAYVSKRMKRETTNIEQAALRRHREATRDGEDPEPPYRSTKYHSKRTVQKAAGILKALVVREWLRSGGQRPLVATMQDIEGLANFFCMNGPHSGFVQAQQAASTDPHERAQMDTILNERKIFAKYFEEVRSETEGVISQNEVDAYRARVAEERSGPATSELAKELIERVRDSFIGDYKGGTRIGHRIARDLGAELLPKVIDPEAAKKLITATEARDSAEFDKVVEGLFPRLLDDSEEYVPPVEKAPSVRPPSTTPSSPSTAAATKRIFRPEVYSPQDDESQPSRTLSESGEEAYVSEGTAYWKPDGRMEARPIPRFIPKSVELISADVLLINGRSQPDNRRLVYLDNRAEDRKVGILIPGDPNQNTRAYAVTEDANVITVDPLGSAINFSGLGADFSREVRFAGEVPVNVQRLYAADAQGETLFIVGSGLSGNRALHILSLDSTGTYIGIAIPLDQEKQPLGVRQGGITFIEERGPDFWVLTQIMPTGSTTERSLPALKPGTQPTFALGRNPFEILMTTETGMILLDANLGARHPATTLETRRVKQAHFISESTIAYQVYNHSGPSGGTSGWEWQTMRVVQPPTTEAP